MISYSPAQWEAFREAMALLTVDVAPMVAVDDRCVNEGGQRDDGSYCRDKAEANGWCVRCWAELVPAPKPV